MTKPALEQIKNLPNDALLTPTEVGRLIGCTGTGVLKKIRRGNIKAVCVAGKWYVTGAEIKSQVKVN